MNKKDLQYTLLAPAAACLLLYFLDRVWQVSYLERTAAKLLLFLTVPLLHSFLFKKPILENLSLRASNREKFSVNFFGIFCFVVIVAAYFLLKQSIDFGSIMNDLQSRSKVNAGNYAAVGLYITFVNSFLEEVFFRGFVFLNLYRNRRQKMAYGYSSLLFALYHLSIFETWFGPGVMFLAVIGLVAAGLLFDYMDVRSETVYHSWTTHIMADAAIILIGCLYIYNGELPRG